MPKIKRINHIGIAVEDIAKAQAFWKDHLGLELTHEEDVTSDAVKTQFFPIGESAFELLEATDETSPIAKFLKKRGQGVHHICIEVDDIEGMLNNLKAKGVQLIDETPRKGAHNSLVAFIHPSATGGVLLELCQS